MNKKIGYLKSEINWGCVVIGIFGGFMASLSLIVLGWLFTLTFTPLLDILIATLRFLPTSIVVGTIGGIMWCKCAKLNLRGFLFLTVYFSFLLGLILAMQLWEIVIYEQGISLLLQELLFSLLLMTFGVLIELIFIGLVWGSRQLLIGKRL